MMDSKVRVEDRINLVKKENNEVEKIMNIINIEHIASVYQVGSEEVHALRDVSVKD